MPPLELPAPDEAEPLDRLRQNEAVMLFTERAAAASGTFELTTANQAAVVGLCRRLDGLPLAIELAAVRTRVLSAEQFLGRLADRFGLLTGGSRAALPRQQTLRTADLEIDNIRAVLLRCLTRAERSRGLELAASLGWYWITRSTTEGIRWLDEFLAAPDGEPQVTGWGYFIRGFLAVLKADPDAARPALHAAVAAARQAGQPALLIEALAMAVNAENMTGDRAAARRLLEEADATAAGLAYPPSTLAVLQARALDSFFAADTGAVRVAAGEGVRLARATGDLYALEIMLLNLGSAALLAGDLGESEPLLTEALRIARQLDDRVAQFYLVGALGCHAAQAGQARLAARLIGAADTARTGAGANIMPFLAPALAQAQATAAGVLGTARFEAEFGFGQHLTRDAALELALGSPAKSVPSGPLPPGPVPPGPAPPG